MRLNRIRPPAFVILVLVGALVALAGCGGSDDGGDSGAPATEAPTTEAPTTTAGGGQASGEDVQLTASDFAWDPTTLTFASGDPVNIEVTNSGAARHNFSFAEANVDQDLPAGEDTTVTFTAPAAGSFDFSCKYHPGSMTGTLTIT